MRVIDTRRNFKEGVNKLKEILCIRSALWNLYSKQTVDNTRSNLQELVIRCQIVSTVLACSLMVVNEAFAMLPFSDFMIEIHT